MTELPEIRSLSARPICSTAFELAWKFAGANHGGFEVHRQQAFEADREWHRVALLPPTARAYESIGLMNAPGRSWRHRVRAIGAGDAAGPWANLPALELPQSPGGPRGKLIVPSAPPALRNISGSFIARKNGELLFGYTPSENSHDYSRSWIAAIALTPAGTWEDRGVLFPSRPDWPVVSRPSFVAMTDGRVLATYSIGKPKAADLPEWGTQAYIHRSYMCISADEGRTWSDERLISDDLYDYELVNSNGTRNVLLSNGRLITSIHVSKPPSLLPFDPEHDASAHNEVMGTYLLLSDDHARTWQRVPGNKEEFFFVPDDPFNRKHVGFHETSIVEYSPGRLLMYGRNATGWLYETRSEDFGSTWSLLVQTQVQYPIAPPNLTRIPGTSTIVLLASPLDLPRDTFHLSNRSILSTQLSDDAGQTWHGYRELEYDGYTADPTFVYGYPDYIWYQDALHVVYTRKHAELYYQRLSKNWLLGREG